MFLVRHTAAPATEIARARCGLGRRRSREL